MVSAVNRIVLRAAATNTPTPKAHSSSVRRIHCSCISGGAWDIRLPHTPARNKDEQIDQQVPEHQECDSRSSKHGCAQRYRSHHARECRFVNLINFVQLRIFHLFRLHPDSPSVLTFLLLNVLLPQPFAHEINMISQHVKHARIGDWHPEMVCLFI